MRPKIGVLMVFALSACGGDDTGRGHGGEGSSCVDGSNCEHGLFCFVQANDAKAGVCTKLPASCGDNPTCTCFDEYDAQCASGIGSCYVFLGESVVGCSQDGAFKQTGEACSMPIHCDFGLYCLVPATGQAGTCKQNPNECGTSPDCDCFDSVRATCSSGSSCSAGGNVTIACH